ncbi:MAG: putative DNA binding domain-containing protein [Candidatus Fermentibacteraceae bacterium]|nr:putative DNA binding domain-containing protein [Candidatus Fermentibacteraceae bacterium]
MKSHVLELIKKGESEIIEFKGSRSPLDSLLRAVCGFLNQQGGFLLWGVDDKGKPTGIDNAEKKVEDLTSRLMSDINPRPFVSVSVQEVKQVSVIVVRVPPGSDKPYSVNRKIWVRIGCSIMRAGGESTVDLVEQSAMDLERWERGSLPGFSIEDCDIEELSKTRKEIAAAGRFGSDIPLDNEMLLEHLYLRRSGLLTNAALVLFASQTRRWSPNVYLRIVSYTSEKAGSLANDVVLDGPAIRTLYEAVSIIQQRTGFSSRFKKDQLEREDKPAYAIYALRESLVNAITHRSYDSIGGCIRVEIYPDHLIISNPGKLPEGWTPKNLREEHKSIPFNPDIARVFFLRKLMDQLGVGTQRMISECKQLGAMTPSWQVEGGIVSVTLFRAPEPAAEEVLTGRQAEFVKSLKRGEEFKTADYATAAGVSQRQARRDLAELEDRGIIERLGKGRATLYLRSQGGAR